MNIEKAAWAALSGAVFSMFWPWIVAQQVMQLSLGEDDSIQK